LKVATTPVGVRDYSEAGEQAMILAWADGRLGGFVDLGAYDGESYSNTAALADLGWPGICVDAAPDAAAACAYRYATNDSVRVILGVFDADDGPGNAAMHWSPGAMYTSLRANERDDIVLVPIEVPRLDLARLAARIESLPRPRFCSVDLEGSSLAALAWLLDHADPACVCVEANVPGDRATVRAMLADWEELGGTDTNLIFARGAS
jgi:FkbM family methyltransferase